MASAAPPADRELLENTHPSGWQNPPSGGHYNLVVVGAGGDPLAGFEHRLNTLDTLGYDEAESPCTKRAVP